MRVTRREAIEAIKGMFEKVNPQHPDKVADRIAGAIVDLAYAKSENPKVATEDMLTPDLLSWTLGATVGLKYSKQFALNKQAQKVKYVATDIVAEEPETPSGGGSNGGGGNNNPPGELEE